MKCIEDEIPFELPRGWEWCRFNCVLDVRDGTHDTPSYIPNGIPLITSKNLSEGGIDYSNVKYISHEDALLINERSGVDKGDILFAMIGTIGNPAMVSDDKLISIKNVALFKFTYSLNINHKYIMAYLDYTQDDMKKRPSGGLQPFVSLNFLRQYFVPIPPISEQHRIVDKLNELLSFVDTIETDKTSLQDLIKQTKSKILDLAIRGKLVPQDPNDEPASVLLERIRAEKEELIKQGKIKRDKKESVIFKGDDNSYYEKYGEKLPSGWVVTNFETILEYEQPTKYIVNDTNYKPTYKTPVLTAGKSFILGYTNETDNIFDDLPVIIFDDFTTESKFVDFPFKVKSSAMKILHINQDLVLPKYAFYLMQATEIDHDNHQRYWISTYSQEIVALPPINEQERILTTLEHYFDLLDTLQ